MKICVHCKTTKRSSQNGILRAMQITIKKSHVVVLLEGSERLYSLKAAICINGSDITSVKWYPGYPLQKELGGLRAPGTAVPFLFQAGSYWYKRTWEFRYLKFREQGQLVVTTVLNKYAKIRITTDESAALDVVEWFNTVKKQRKVA